MYQLVIFESRATLDMKFFRLIEQDGIFSYCLKEEKVFRLKAPLIELLKKSDVCDTDIESQEMDFGYDEIMRSYGLPGNFAKPFDPPEVWGAGITYHASRDRYSMDGVATIFGKSIYEIVYDAERPELFFKATPDRCVGHNQSIRIKSSSSWTLPEPELGVVLSSHGKVLAYTIVDDVSARDIEAMNPLYLPESKIYSGCCAFGPFLVTPDEVPDPYSLEISMKIIRSGDIYFEGRTNTSGMKTRIDKQIHYLLEDNIIPDGTLLSTGTSIVPGRSQGLVVGDLVEISITGMGVLKTTVL